jgi:hypothetical protein
MPIEPLEPDAGNAAEGRSEPDGHLSHAFSRAWIFIFRQNIKKKKTNWPLKIPATQIL